MYCVRMRDSSSALDQFLDELARDARPGDRLPPIRDLMRRFGASQMVVQRALQGLKARGSITSQVGRGTYFRGEGGPVAARAGERSPEVKSVLLLRRSISIIRGRVLMEGLQRRFTADGHRVLELSYTDPDHARTILKGLPRFDACVVQSTFKILAIELLAALREKCDVLAVDGATLAGTDVEAVGMEWGEPLAAAVALLRQRGHRRIAYATTAHPFLASQLGRRRFDHLQQTLVGAELSAILVPKLPDDGFEAALVALIKAELQTSGRPPFSALVAWGIEDGAQFRRLLAEAGIGIPLPLSVVLLGRTDLANEHAGFFDTFGCRVADQIEYLHQAVTARWADPSLPYGVRLIPVASRDGASVAAPPPADEPPAPRVAKRAKPRGEPQARAA